MKRHGWALVGALAVFAGGAARAEGVHELVSVLPSGKACAQKSGVCFAASGRDTVAVEANKAGSPRFARGKAVAKVGEASPSGAHWQLELNANLKRAAVNGNALFVFFDLNDPNAVRNREATVLYQTPIKPGKSVGVRFSLSPDEGFHAGHSYRLRVVQLVGGKELVLAEGDFSLL